MLKTFWWGASIAYTIFLTVVSLISLGDLPELGSDFDDKLYHLGAYIVLGFLWAWVAQTTRKKNALIISLLVTLLYGIFLEMIQHKLNPTRTFDLVDMLSNCIGVGFGTIIAAFVYKQKVKLN